MKTERFRVDDVVKFKDTGSSVLDGTFGTILGYASDFPEIQFMIVELPVPYCGNKAIVMITSCLELYHRPVNGVDHER